MLDILLIFHAKLNVYVTLHHINFKAEAKQNLNSFPPPPITFQPWQLKLISSSEINFGNF